MFKLCLEIYETCHFSKKKVGFSKFTNFALNIETNFSYILGNLIFRMPAPRILTFAEYDKKEKPMSKKLKNFIENIVIITKVKQGGKSMTKMAYSIAGQLEKKFGGSWVVFIEKQGSESGSCCVSVQGTHCLVKYEGEIYEIFQSKLDGEGNSVR